MPVEDFDTYHGGAVGPPQGWVQAVTGSGAIVYNQDVQGGTVNLATGATQDSEALLYLNNNILIPSQEGSFQCHLANISAVTSICIRVGLMPRAAWATMAAVGAIPAIGGVADYFIYEFDTASGISAVNWVLRYQTGGAGELTINSGIPAVVTTTKLLALIDQATLPLGYVNGIPTRANVVTEVSGALMAPGIVISNRSAADRNLNLDMIGWEGRRS